MSAPRSPNERYESALGNPGFDEQANKELTELRPEELGLLLEAKLAHIDEQKHPQGYSLNFQRQYFINKKTLKIFINVILKYPGCVHSIDLTHTGLLSSQILPIINQLITLENPPNLHWKPSKELLKVRGGGGEDPDQSAYCMRMIEYLNSIRKLHFFNLFSIPLPTKIIMKNICRTIIKLESEILNSWLGNDSRRAQSKALQELIDEITTLMSGDLHHQPLARLNKILQESSGEFSSVFTEDRASTLFAEARNQLSSPEFTEKIYETGLIVACGDYWTQVVKKQEFANKGKLISTVEHALILYIANISNRSEQEEKFDDVSTENMLHSNALYCLQLGEFNLAADKERAYMWFDIVVLLPDVFTFVTEALENTSAGSPLSQTIRHFLEFALENKHDYESITAVELAMIQTALDKFQPPSAQQSEPQEEEKTAVFHFEQGPTLFARSASASADDSVLSINDIVARLAEHLEAFRSMDPAKENKLIQYLSGVLDKFLNQNLNLRTLAEMETEISRLKSATTEVQDRDKNVLKLVNHLLTDLREGNLTTDQIKEALKERKNKSPSV